MKRYASRIALATALISALMALLTPTSARASIRSLSCTADGDVLHSYVYYYTSGGEWFADYVNFVIENNYQDHNNVIQRIRRDDNGFIWWSWTSPDNVLGEQNYRLQSDVHFSKSGRPYLYGWMRPDQAGVDPTCSARSSTIS